MNTAAIQKNSPALDAINPTFVSLKWTKDIFTVDDVIDAYKIGKEHGKVENSEAFLETLKANLTKAMGFSDGVYERIKSTCDIAPLGMKMRINGISSFEVLIIIAKEDFISEKIEKLYDFLFGESKKINDGDKFCWLFTLMPQRGKLNDLAIASDGYMLSYAASG